MPCVFTLLGSYLALTGMAALDLKAAHDASIEDPFLLASCGIISAYAVLGFFKSISGCKTGFLQLHQVFTDLIPTLALSMYCTNVWITNHLTETEEMAYSFTAVGGLMALIPYVLCIDRCLLDFVVMCETGALGAAGYELPNPYIMWAGLIFAVAHFYLSYCRIHCARNATPNDFYNFAMSAYCYCVMKAMVAAK